MSPKNIENTGQDVSKFNLGNSTTLLQLWSNNLFSKFLNIKPTWDVSFIYLFYSVYMVVDSQIILDDYQC